MRSAKGVHSSSSGSGAKSSSSISPLNPSASAGTHDEGGNTDSGQYSDPQLAIWRAMGWAMQRRTGAQGFSAAHAHGWPIGCPHLSPAAAAQATDWKAGRDGLRTHGLITGPGPKSTAPRWDVALTAYINKVGTAPTRV